MRISSIFMILVIETVLQISIVDKKNTQINWLHLARSLPMLKVHRSTSSCLRRMQELSPINTIMPLGQKDRWTPNQFTSCPFLTLPHRKDSHALLFRVGRNEVKWSTISNHKCVLKTFCHVMVALRAWKLL